MFGETHLYLPSKISLLCCLISMHLHSCSCLSTFDHTVSPHEMHFFELKVQQKLYIFSKMSADFSGPHWFFSEFLQILWLVLIIQRLCNLVLLSLYFVFLYFFPLAFGLCDLRKPPMYRVLGTDRDIKCRLMDEFLIAGELKAVISQYTNGFSSDSSIGINHGGSSDRFTFRFELILIVVNSNNNNNSSGEDSYSATLPRTV